MAHALTAARLVLVAPVALAFARPEFLNPSVLLLLLWVAIATDYWDGRVARKTGTASARGQLFDHVTDFIFVTTALTGAALAGLVTPFLPVLIIVAFGQYVLDSYLVYRQKELRMSVIGRWNGILYFVPLVVISVSRLDLFRDAASLLTQTAGALSYALVASTSCPLWTARSHRRLRTLTETNLHARRCIPPGGVAPRSNMPNILPRHAWPGVRLAGLGATRDFHHGLLARHDAEGPPAVWARCARWWRSGRG